VADLSKVAERMDSAESMWETPSLPPHLPIDQLVQGFQRSQRRLLCLGLVGCLAQKRTKGMTFEQFAQFAK